MQLSDFDYYLPKHMIAQTPAELRDHAKLLVVNISKNNFNHQTFNQIKEHLKPGDTLVVNDSRVVNARIFARKPTGGKVELLILEPHKFDQKNMKDDLIIECLIKGKVRAGLTVELKGKSNQNRNLKAKILEKIDGGRYKIEFNSKQPISEILASYGNQPLPPYIKEDLKVPERYQTVYSKNDGSVAAPTAGLHFTPELLADLKDNGVLVARITLHISYGTFTPVRINDISQHRMEQEYAILTKENATLINAARASENKRLVAVGTTTVRTLEAIALNNLFDNVGKLSPWEGWTDLFIYPGFKFKAGIDILITNFHLPKSTLLMLVSAFAGRDNILKAYQEAINEKYRFYSLGDAMMIIR